MTEPKRCSHCGMGLEKGSHGSLEAQVWSLHDGSQIVRLVMLSDYMKLRRWIAGLLDKLHAIRNTVDADVQLPPDETDD